MADVLDAPVFRVVISLIPSHLFFLLFVLFYLLYNTKTRIH